MTASTLLPSTQLALLQERILERTNYTRDEALGLDIRLLQYTYMLEITHNSNLHARQAFIRAGLRYLMRVGVPSEDYAAAYALMKPLIRGDYWKEGPSYLDYVGQAVMWHRRVTGLHTDAESDLERMQHAYLRIIAPDGNIPVPEAAEGWGGPGPRPGLPDSITDDKYIVQRWPSSAYLLVDVGAECDPANLHDWLSAGYFAFGKYEKTFPKEVRQNHDFTLSIDYDTVWVWEHRCPPYSGFSWANVLRNETLAACLPKGALLPGWRLKPPRVTVVKGDSSVTVTWKYPWLPKIQRRIYWSDKLVLVADQTGWPGRTTTRSWVVG